jgi:hypothetical protein
MKYKEPNPDKFTTTQEALDKAEREFNIKPQILLAGLHIKMKSDSPFADMKTIQVAAYQANNVYYVFAVNGSLDEMALLFRAILSDDEIKAFEEYYENADFLGAIDYLAKNTF